MPMKLIRFWVFCSAFFPLALWAEQPPVAVNSAIMGVYFDLDRYETRLQTLKPGDEFPIRSMARGVEITSARLESAPNKEDPSWKHAEQRLDKVKKALADLGVDAATEQHPPRMPDRPEALPPLLNADQRADLALVSRDMDTLWNEVQALQPEVLSKPDVERQWHERMRRMQSTMTGFRGGMFNPEVAAVQSKLDRAWMVLEQKQAQAVGMWRPASRQR